MIQKFEFNKTEIPDLIEVTPFNADDVRGCFTKRTTRKRYLNRMALITTWRKFFIRQVIKV